ncbi:hypothetical protein ROS9278_04038 [Roseomonas sp. CECT 9278]|nr:hypothetical protein ROS9278_04038 [Roseomonas sp. CECT 9278]
MRLRAAYGLAAAALLAGCGGGTSLSTNPPAPCPRITILADGADLTRHRDGAVPDLASMTSDARLIGFNANCDYTRRRDGVSVRISAIFDVERGPAATAPRVSLPWFIAVTDAGDGQIIERRDYVTPAEFAANANRVRIASTPVVLSFPAEERLVENHNVRLSFQLTPDDLERNRRRGPR